MSFRNDTVVIIIGILAAIAIPAFLANRERAQDSAVAADLRNAGAAANICFTETSNWASCDSDAELDPYGFNESAEVTTTYNVAGGVLTITGVHVDNPAASGTWDSASGNYTQT